MTELLFHAPRRIVRRIFLHCSASETHISGRDLVNVIDGWHRSRGFAEIGYHFVVDKEGIVLPARSLEKTPAAQKGNNTATIAICVHGLEFRDTWPHSAQASAVINLCGQINSAYRGIIAFWGHNEVSAKACPVFDYRTLLSLDRWRRMP
jgi:hypothetical protein